MRIFSVGTRPDYIHLASMLDYFYDDDYFIVDTGQHYDRSLSTIFKDGLGIKPKYIFNVRKDHQADTFADILQQLVILLKKEKNVEVYVIGDTNSSLASTFASKLCGHHTVHIESGLRCYSEIPEEKIRRAIDSMADECVVPEIYGKTNLEREGMGYKVIRPPINFKLNTFFRVLNQQKDHMEKPDVPYNIMTIHRQENQTKKRLEMIFNMALKENEYEWIFPIHPRTSMFIKNSKIDVPYRIKLFDPLDYVTMVKLIMHCNTVYTDSGGVTLEAGTLCKRLYVCSERLEWEHINAKCIP